MLDCQEVGGSDSDQVEVSFENLLHLRSLTVHCQWEVLSVRERDAITLEAKEIEVTDTW